MLRTPARSGQPTQRLTLLRFSPGVKIVALLLLVIGALLIARATGSSAKSVAESNAAVSKGAITIKAAGRGKPYLNFQDGQRSLVNYRGVDGAAQALRAQQAQPRSLAAADLDRNATPDLIAGYSWNGAGIVTVQRGNPDAFAPADESVYARMQQGYNPDSLLPDAEVYQVPEPVDFLQAGDFDDDNRMDVLAGARGGDLYLLAGDGYGGLKEARRIDLPGAVTMVATGEFRYFDGKLEIAVGVDGPAGPQLLVYDGADGGLKATPMTFALPGPATAAGFGDFDSDPFLDLAVAVGRNIEFIHGWGRKTEVSLPSRVETFSAGGNIRDLSTGFYVWNREGKNQLAMMTEDGAVHVLQHGAQNELQFSEAENQARGASRGRLQRSPADFDVEKLVGWGGPEKESWTISREVKSDSGLAGGLSPKVLSSAHIAPFGTDSLLVAGRSNHNVQVIQESRTSDKNGLFVNEAGSQPAMASIDLATSDTTVAVLPLQRKLNGERSVVVLQAGSAQPTIVPIVPNATITVDRADDNAAASACTGAASDCSLRGAITFANANPGTTITVPDPNTIGGSNHTFTLSIAGTGGCVNESVSTGNTLGDLEVNGDGTTINGSGSATTIILQAGTGGAPGAGGDRVMCLDASVAPNIDYTFSGFTLAGGRDHTAFGGGGIIGGAKGCTLSLTNVKVVNNQTKDNANLGGLGGGGVSIEGGSLTITNSTIGGTADPGASRTDLTLGNSAETSGGALFYTFGDPNGIAGTTGTLTVTGSTISHNTSNAATAGGGGLDLTSVNTGNNVPPGSGGSASIDNSTFSNNKALGTASGGAIIVESLPVTVGTTATTTSFTNNTAGNRSGGIYVAGGSLTLDATLATITLTGNTAGTSDTSTISTASAVTAKGTLLSLDGDLEVTTNGSWTNQNGTGVNISPTNLVIQGTGIWTSNDSTTNVAGNFKFLGGTFNSNTGTFNFNGSGAQAISGPSSPTFNQLTVNKSGGTLTLSVNAPVKGNLTVTAGIFDLTSFLVDRTASGGTLTVSNGTTLKIGGTNTFPANYSTHSIGATSTEEYEGTSQTVATLNSSQKYGFLTISGSGTKTLQGNIGIASDLTISGGTLDASASNFNIDIAGHWINNVAAANFTPRAATVTFSSTGATQSIKGSATSQTFNSITMNKSGQTLNVLGSTTSLTLNGTLTLTAGTFDKGTAAAINVAGNWTNSVGASGFTAGSGTVTLNGNSVTQTLSGNTTFNNLTIADTSGTIAFGSTTTTIGNTLSRTAGTTMDPGTGTITFTGGAGSITGASLKTFNNLVINSGAVISNSTGGNLQINNNFTDNGTFTQAASISTTFAGSSVTHNFSGGGTTTFGTVIINSTNTVDAGSHNFSVAGDFTVTGTFTGNTSTVTFIGTVLQTLGGSGTKTFNNLTINNGVGGSVLVSGSSPTVNGLLRVQAGTFTTTPSSTLHDVEVDSGATLAGTSATTMNVSGNWSNGGTFTANSNTVNFNGSSAQTIGGSNVTTFNNLTINNSSGGVSLNTDEIVGGALTLTSGALAVGTHTLTLNGAVSATSGSLTSSPTGTVSYNQGSVGQATVLAANYGNLTFSNFSKTLASSGTIGIAGTFTPGSGSGHTITGSTIDFNGTGAQTVPAFTYNNLTISNTRTGTNSVTFVSGGTVKIAGTFTPSAIFGTGGYVVTNNTIEFNGIVAQSLPASASFGTYNNLTLNNSAGVAGASGILVNGTLEVAKGTFTNSNSTPAPTYNNVQIDATGTLATPVDTNVTGNWTDNGTLTPNTSAVIFNGTAAQTVGLSSSSTTPFYKLTISNTSATVSLGHNVTVSNQLTVSAGATFDLGTFTATSLPVGATTSIANGATLRIGGTNGFPASYAAHLFGATSTVEYYSSSAQTITALPEAYGNLVSSGSGARTLPSGQTVKIFTAFTPGTNAYTITGSTVDFDGDGAETIPAFSFNNLTLSNVRTGANSLTLAPGGTIKIAGNFTATATFGTGGYVVASDTIEFNGAAAQSMPPSFTTYNNLTISNSSVAGVTGFSGLTVNGLMEIKTGSKFTSSTTYNNLQIDSGGILAAAANIDVNGNWTNNGGTFTANGNTVNFNGSGAQTIGGTATTTFDNLNIANAGSGVTLGHDETVNGLLTLTNDLNTSTFTLTQPNTGTSAGAGDVVGNLKRTGFSTSGANTLSFGNPLNTIQINSDTVGGDTISITTKLTKGTTPDNSSTGGTNSGFPGAIKRTYLISPTGITGAISATLQLRYLTSPDELNGNAEATLRFWKFIGTGWQQQDLLGTSTTVDLVNHDVMLTGVTGFSPWTLATVSPTAANGNVSGRIADANGNPVEGAGVRLSGTENRLTVTDAQGNYHFDNVETNGFYTVTPSRANFSFSPAQRSFSQLGLHTDAAFSATANSNPVNPLDTSEYFVRQQYVDFLNREPDEAGLSFWVNNIESCGTNAQCREAKRIDTSAAFFLSIEFQQTGYLVYRSYQAAYGDMPNTPVPLRLNEFKSDSQEIGNGVVVLQPGWEQTLEHNKQSFATDFVQRARFAAAYPAAMTPAEFVDRLFANAGVTPSDSDRTGAISEFGPVTTVTTTGDVGARARTLRRVAESAAVVQKEFSSAFVLMEYFGYLRRDADASPDTNFDGYNFWLAKLDTFKGNYQQAELVKAFLSSTEYRGRFSR